MATSVFVCESQPIVVEGLRALIDSSGEFVFAGASQSLPEALEQVRRERPSVVLIDQQQGYKAALQFISDVRAVAPESKPVLWVHELAEVECFRVLQLGARGVVRRNMAVGTLLECIRTVASGSVWVENALSPQVTTALQRHGSPRLTRRERDIVRCICQGLKNKEIAASLSITPGTVKVHLMHIFEKTGVKDRFELAIQGRQLTAESAAPAAN